MDKIEQEFDRYSHMVNQRDYSLVDMMSEFYVNNAQWLVSQRPRKVGVFKRNKPRVK